MRVRDRLSLPLCRPRRLVDRVSPARGAGEIGNLRSGVRVWVNAVPSPQVTWYSATRMDFQSPHLNTTGYVNVTLVNPDGGWITLADALFYTVDCPLEGT